MIGIVAGQDDSGSARRRRWKMHPRNEVLLTAILGLTVFGEAAQAFKPVQSGATAIRSETRLVLVDTIVTDKKGDYIRDLAPTEFHVREDNKEQAIKSVTREFPATPASSSPTHTVLFFGRISVEDQPYAREAAVKFIEANAAPNRQMAILNYLGSGGTKVIQTFTADSDPLKNAAKNMEASAVLSASSGTGVSVTMSSVYSDPDTTGVAAAFDVRSHLHALVGVAKTLASLPGRKAIVVLAPTINYGVQARSDPSSVGAGIIGSTIRAPAPPEVDYYVHPEDMAAAIDACNRAKVAIYLIDVRVDHTPVENQLAPLATATGGLAIDNSKDAFNALRKIAQDQEERYVIAYSPSKSGDEICHKIRVRVDRGGAIVRSRTEYCDIDSKDPLAGRQVGRDLEARTAGSQAGNIAAQMQSSFFYTAPDRARIHITAEVSTAATNFVRQNGKFHASMNVLGIATTPEGGVGARFSDTVDFDFQSKKEVEQFKQHPYHYENDVGAPAGQYDLKVVFSPDRDNFGKLETPVVIEPWDGQHFALSGVALSRESRNVSATQQTNAFLTQDRSPLVSRGLQFLTTGSNRYRKTDPAMLYVEIYEPLLHGPDPPKVMIQLMIVDRKSGTIKLDSGPLDMTNRVLPGNPVVPVGLKVPIDSLTPGAYTVVLKASDTAGNASIVRQAVFEVE
jgi:VWFA-related protein